MVQEESETKLNTRGNRRGMSPNSRKNLETGRNKNGRPKDEDAISTILRELGSGIPIYPKGDGKEETRTRREIACERLWGIATYGDPNHVISAISFIAERTEGKVTQPIGGEGGKDLIFNIVVSGEQAKDMVSRVLAGERTD